MLLSYIDTKIAYTADLIGNGVLLLSLLLFLHLALGALCPVNHLFESPADIV